MFTLKHIYIDNDLLIKLNLVKINKEYVNFSLNIRLADSLLSSSSIRAKLVSNEEIDEDSMTGESYLSTEYWGEVDKDCELGIRVDSDKGRRVYLKNIDCPKISFDLSDKMLLEK